MLKFSTKNRYHGDVEYSSPRYEPGDYIVDLSAYTPTATMVRGQVASPAANADPSTWSYDFKDGKDTGMVIPPTRYVGIDPVDVQSYKDSLEKEIGKSVQKDLDAAALKAMEEAETKASAEPVQPAGQPSS